MMDTQDTNLPKEEKVLTGETGKLEESQAPEANPVETASEASIEAENPAVEESAEQSMSDEVVEDEVIAPLDAAALAIITKPELLERLGQIAAEPKRYMRSEIDMLKQAYYRIRRAEIEAKKKEFLEEEEKKRISSPRKIIRKRK